MKLYSIFTSLALLGSVVLTTSSVVPEHKTWVIANGFMLPQEPMTAKCTFHRGPALENKNHIIGYDFYKPGLPQTLLTHHADIFKCSAPEGVDPIKFFEPYIESQGYDCYETNATNYFPKEYCQLYLEWSQCYEWCRDQRLGRNVKFDMDDSGMPLEPNDVFMMHAHFENPELKAGLYVESGMEFYYTDKLRSHDAAHILIGQDVHYNYLMIPPNSAEFTLARHCVSDCTEKLPHEINIIRYTYHTHQYGKKMKIRHFRNGVELPLIAENDMYDPMELQVYRDLTDNPIKILPGDDIALECTYDTRFANGKAVIGGPTSFNEMCLAFIVYYPYTEELVQCGSGLVSSTTYNFLGVHNVTGSVHDRKVTSSGEQLTHVIEGMDWTAEQRSQYQEIVTSGDHDAYCYGAHAKHSYSISHPPGGSSA